MWNWLKWLKSKWMKCSKSIVSTFKDDIVELLENTYYDTSLSSQLYFVETVKSIDVVMGVYKTRCKIDYYRTLYNVARFIPTLFISKYRLNITKALIGVCDNGNGGVKLEVYTNNGSIVCGGFELSLQIFPINHNDVVRYEGRFIVDYRSIPSISDETFVTDFTVYPEDTYEDILDKFDEAFRKLDGYLSVLIKNKEEVTDDETTRETENVNI